MGKNTNRIRQWWWCAGSQAWWFVMTGPFCGRVAGCSSVASAGNPPVPSPGCHGAMRVACEHRREHCCLGGLMSWGARGVGDGSTRRELHQGPCHRGVGNWEVMEIHLANDGWLMVSSLHISHQGWLIMVSWVSWWIVSVLTSNKWWLLAGSAWCSCWKTNLILIVWG